MPLKLKKTPVKGAVDHIKRALGDEHFHWLDLVCERIRKACVPDDIMARNALHRIEAKSQVRGLMLKHDGDTRAACKELLVTLGVYQADEEDRRQAEELCVRRMAVRDRFAVLMGKGDESWGEFAARCVSTKSREHAAAQFVEAGGAKGNGHAVRQETKRMDMDEKMRQADATAGQWIGAT